MLILKYDRLNLFNNRVYTEDTKECYTKEDLKKVFAYFSKAQDATIQIDNTITFWDSMEEYENRIATVREFEGINYTETKKSYEKVKRECYAMAL